MSPLAMAFPSPTQELASKHAEQSNIERQESAAANIKAQHASRGPNAIQAKQLGALLKYRHTRRSKLLQLGCTNILASVRAALDMHFRSPTAFGVPHPTTPYFQIFRTCHVGPKHTVVPPSQCALLMTGHAQHCSRSCWSHAALRSNPLRYYPATNKSTLRAPPPACAWRASCT